MRGASPVATLTSKRAMEMNRDPWGTLFITNAVTALVFLPLFAWESKRFDLERAWQPLVAGALFVAAQVAAYKSFAVGDLSVAVPAQGTKVLAATLWLAGVASMSFAAFDVLVRKWSPAWGKAGFGSWVFLTQGVIHDMRIPINRLGFGL